MRLTLMIPLLSFFACAESPCMDGYGRDADDNCVALASGDDATDPGSLDNETDDGSGDDDSGDSGDGGSGDGGSGDTGGDGGDTGAAGADDTGAAGADDTSAAGDSSADTAAGEWDDVWEGWPSTTFFPTYCGDCHPTDMTSGAENDWTVYEHVMIEYDHIYCGVGLEMVSECGDHHEPGHLPQPGGPQPTDDERYRLIAWMDAGMPRE